MGPELAHALTTVDPVQLGARVKAARIAAGLTQPQLAAESASVGFLSRIETGQRRPSPELLETLAVRLGVAVDYLVIGDGWEEARRIELQLDHAELSLVGGEANRALSLARSAAQSSSIDTIPGGDARARYVEAAALDALGDEGAAAAFTALLATEPEGTIRLKAATALCRIWRERGQFDRAVSSARSVLETLPAESAASEEGIRLSVTLAAALFMGGRIDEAADICDRAIAEAEQLSSPVARASAYWNASMIRADSGDLTEALTLARRALHLLENTERVRDLARLRTQLSLIMLKADPPRLDDAKEQLQLADTELEWSEASPADRARHELVNAQALFMEGEHEAARLHALTVLDVAGDGLPLVAVQALTLLGQLEWADGEREHAHDWYRQAIVRLTGAGADREAAQLWFELGTLASTAGLVAEAADAFRRAAVSTGLQARLPVVNQPPQGTPRTTPSTAPAGRV